MRDHTLDTLLEEFARRRSEGLGETSIAGFVLGDIDRLVQAVRELRDDLYHFNHSTMIQNLHWKISL